jgi:nanoRNase/pAp phosphatase (c-di-AMP/oligoRNAs hydrolase)
MVRENINSGKRRMVIGGVNVPVCNAPYSMASDTGNLLSKGEPFAATYTDLGDGRRSFSLRSSDEGADVSVVAKKYGGGGHRNAAGFTAAGNWEGDPS